ncbi:glycerophosphodiester phosphodiesterase [Psychrobacter sp. DM4]|uniref:glycerophosphodiester phosphodiesterase n=1 Tax=Psychrobacter sp. DM4 TaxID=3440637 RepID=UPI003F4FAD5F
MTMQSTQIIPKKQNMLNLNRTRLIGHRGAGSEILENTLSGFQRARSLQARGLAGVEFDVQLSGDGHLVVFHDETLQRLCGAQSRIDQLTLPEIQRHLQSGHQIITLAMLSQTLPLSSAPLSSHHTPNSPTDPLNVFNSTQASVLNTASPVLSQFNHIELEIKTHNRTHYGKLVAALSRDLVDTALASLPLVLTSFDRQLLAHLQRHKTLSSIPRGLLTRTPSFLAAAPTTAMQLGCTQLGVHYPLLTQSVIENSHRHGLPVTAWTVNDVDSAQQLVKWQVDVIVTDVPTLFL